MWSTQSRTRFLPVNVFSIMILSRQIKSYGERIGSSCQSPLVFHILTFRIFCCMNSWNAVWLTRVWMWWIFFIHNHEGLFSSLRRDDVKWWCREKCTATNSRGEVNTSSDNVNFTILCNWRKLLIGGFQCGSIRRIFHYPKEVINSMSAVWSFFFNVEKWSSKSMESMVNKNPLNGKDNQCISDNWSFWHSLFIQYCPSDLLHLFLSLSRSTTTSQQHKASQEYFDNLPSYSWAIIWKTIFPTFTFVVSQ